ETVFDALRQGAAAMQVTVNSLVQASWGILLGRYNDRQDVVFGTIVSGRPATIVGVEAMAGLFINVIPVRVTFCEQETVEQVLGRVQRATEDGLSHHYIPLPDIQTSPKMVDHLLVYESYPIDERLLTRAGAGDRALRVTDVQTHEQTHYDLTV